VKNTNLRVCGAQLLKSVGHCTLAVDGAEDGGKENVVHVMALTPKPHFLGAVRFGSRKQSHQNIVEQLKQYHERLKALGVKIKGIVTDNENKMKLMRTLHAEKFGGCAPGCGPHAGNLVSGDLFKKDNIKKILGYAKIVANGIKVCMLLICLYQIVSCSEHKAAVFLEGNHGKRPG